VIVGVLAHDHPRALEMSDLLNFAGRGALSSRIVRERLELSVAGTESSHDETLTIM